MNLAHGNGHHLLVHFSREELLGVSNAINEVCNGVHIDDVEFSTRLGMSREALRSTLRDISKCLDHAPDQYDAVSVQPDGTSVQVRCITVFGDPVDMSSDEARTLAGELKEAADRVDQDA